MLVISFSHMDFHQSPLDFWGQSAFKKIGVSVLGVTAKGNHWYPTSLRDIPEVIAPLENHSFRIGYGFSMGAYGAIKFSRLIQADVTLALSPQFSINPEFGDWRYSNHFPPPNDGGGPLTEDDIGGEIVLAYDPSLKEDALAADQILGIWQDTRQVYLPGAGHFTSDVIASSKKLNAILSVIRSEDRSALQDILHPTA